MNPIHTAIEAEVTNSRSLDRVLLCVHGVAAAGASCVKFHRATATPGDAFELAMKISDHTLCHGPETLAVNPTEKGISATQYRKYPGKSALRDYEIDDLIEVSDVG